MRLKPTYDKNNVERIYREDETREYLFFKDKKHGIIIRDFTMDDTKVWFNCMINTKKGISATQKNDYMKYFQNLVKKQQADDDETSFMITDLTGKMLGEIEVKLCYENKSECEIEVYLKDDFVKEQKGEAVMEAIFSLHHEHYWFDAIYLKDDEGNRIKLAS